MKNKIYFICLSLFISLNTCTGTQIVKSEIVNQKQIHFKIDEFADEKNFVRLKGWVALEGEQSKNDDLFIGLNKMDKYRVFPVLKEKRTDIPVQVGRNFTTTGFAFAINKNYLESGTYGIHLLLKQGNSEIRKETGLLLKVDKTNVEPLKTGTEWIESYHLGDSKLINFQNEVITFTTNGQLLYKKNNGKLDGFTPSISANWFNFNRINNEQVVTITGSFDKNSIEVHEINLKSGISKLLSVVKNGGNLKIDPTLISANNGYFATYTEIEGNINRSDQTLENGFYKIHLYYSPDLKNWNFVRTILSEKRNLEDGILFVDHKNKLSFLYEEEDFDKGHSKIKVISSSDWGKSWSHPKVILSNIADHEPAKLIGVDKDKYYFFYSSDLDNHGVGSYEYSKMKYAILDSNFQVIQKDSSIDSEVGAMLYDTIEVKGIRYFLYAKDADTHDQLILFSSNK